MQTQITIEEINQVLADEGYSADRRKGRLKEILTEVTAYQEAAPTPEQAELIAHVKAILDDNQDGEPIAKDTL